MSRAERRRQAKLAKKQARSNRSDKASLQAAADAYEKGVKCQASGQLKEALQWYEKAVAMQPDHVGAKNGLGEISLSQGRMDEALAFFMAAVEIKPGFVPALFNLGSTLFRQRDVERGVKYLKKAIAIKPDYADAHNTLGEIHIHHGETGAALLCFEKALSLEPEHAVAHYNIGNANKQMQKLAKAALSYEKALLHKPDFPEALRNFADIHKAEGRLEETIECLEKAVALKPDFYEAISNLGIALKEQGRLDEAIECQQKAITVKGDYHTAFINLGVALKIKGRLQEAASNLEQAIAIKPDSVEAHWNLAVIYLNQGELKKGWQEYEWRIKRVKEKIRTMDVAMWSGSSLQGKSIAVYAEQGVGDEVQFACCIPDLLRLGPRQLLVECDPRLAPLFSRSFPGVHICHKKKNQDLTWIVKQFKPDFAMPVGSLMKFFRNSAADFPNRAGYLAPDPVLVEMWNQRLRELGPGLKVGISWRGGKDKDPYSDKSIALDAWRSVLAQKAVFINLQYGDVAHDIREAREKLGVVIHDWEDNDPLKDLDSQAALLSALDLVISVDNATVHMSGAVGAKTWCLLISNQNWSWMNTFARSTPFYPSVRLYRRELLSNWDRVIQDVARDLGRFLADASMS